MPHGQSGIFSLGWIRKNWEKVSAESEKLRSYCAQRNQYRQNNFFQFNQKALFQELGGKERPAQVPSNAEEAKEFCSKLSDNPIPYKEGVGWLKEVELELENANIQESRNNLGRCYSAAKEYAELEGSRVEWYSGVLAQKVY